MATKLIKLEDGIGALGRNEKKLRPPNAPNSPLKKGTLKVTLRINPTLKP